MNQAPVFPVVRSASGGALPVAPQGRVVIPHQQGFKLGVRVLMLTARHKDGIKEERKVYRVSYDAPEFDREFKDLLEMMRPGERVYVSASGRCMSSAIRIFRERQLANEYDAEPEAFYRSLGERWLRCLMDPYAQSERLFVFDCDQVGELNYIRSEIMKIYGGLPYVYETKSGMHIVTGAFDRTRLPDEVKSTLHTNAMILWAYA